MTGRRGEPEREGAGGKSWRVGEPPPQTDLQGMGIRFCSPVPEVPSAWLSLHLRSWRSSRLVSSASGARLRCFSPFDRVPGKGALNTAAQLHVPARVHWGSELVLGRRMR